MNKLVKQFLFILLIMPLSSHANYGSDPIEAGWEKATEAIKQGNFQLAVETWLPLAEKGHVGSAIHLENLIEEHIQLADSNPQVVSFIKASAHRNNVHSQLLMIKIYLHQNQPEKAKYWLERVENNDLVLWDSDKARIQQYRQQIYLNR